MAISPPKRLGFFAGVRGFFGGVGFVVGTPSVWGWALIPMAVFAVLFGLLGGAGIWFGSEAALRLVPETEQGLVAAGLVWALRVLFWLASLVVALFVAMSLAQPLSGFALEAIARRQDPTLDVGARNAAGGALASMLRSLKVSMTALAIGLPVLGLLALVTLLVPPAAVVTVPLKFAVTGLLAAYDFFDYPLSLRGLGVRPRIAFMRAHFGAMLGFGLSAAAVLLIPGAGLLLLPFGVAGATRIVRDAAP
jgi:CysZ protein